MNYAIKNEFRWNTIKNLNFIFILVIIVFAISVITIILVQDFQLFFYSNHLTTFEPKTTFKPETIFVTKTAFDTKEYQYLFENEANSEWFPDGTVGDNIKGYPYFIDCKQNINEWLAKIHIFR